MGALRRRWLGLLALLLTAAGCLGSSSSSHSLRYFYMSMSEPGQGLPQFSFVGYVDEQPFVTYGMNGSITKRVVPLVPWMEKAVKDDPQYWEYNTQNVRNSESSFRVGLETLRGRYNQSRGGLHTLQVMYGCEVDLNWRLSRGYDQHAYDGEDFLAFDMETVTWTAPVPQALPTKIRWEKESLQGQYMKSYLEGLCVEWLRRYLDYGNETLLRTEAPTGKVARKAKDVGLETLICQVHGFYPKAIGVTWLKDGVDQVSETLTGGVIPNADGTYHTWLSIDIDPKERDLYQCHVEHDGLPERLVLTWDEPASAINLGLILGILGAILAVAVIASIIFVFLKKRGGKRGNDYRAAPGSDQGSDNSTKVVVAEA